MGRTQPACLHISARFTAQTGNRAQRTVFSQDMVILTVQHPCPVLIRPSTGLPATYKKNNSTCKEQQQGWEGEAIPVKVATAKFFHTGQNDCRQELLYRLPFTGQNTSLFPQ